MSCTALDPDTGLLSGCLLERVDVAFGSIFCLFSAVHCFSFFGHARGRLFWRDWCCVTLIAAIFLAKLPSISAIGPLSVLAIQLIQMGRTTVTPSLLSIWWLTTMFLSTLMAAEDFLATRSFKESFILASAALGLVLSHPSSKSTDFDNSNIFSKITRSYFRNMLNIGRKGQITRSDLPKPSGELKAELNLRRLESQLCGKSGGLMWALLSSVGWNLCLILLLQTISSIVTFSGPFFLRLFLSSLYQWVAGAETSLVASYWFGIAIGIVPLISTMLENVAQILADYNHTASRTALTLLIYRKGMRLGPKGRREFDSAKIMNLVDVDTIQAIDLVNGDIFNGLIAAPIGFVVGFTQLWSLVGSTIFAGISYYGLFGIALAFIFSFVPGFITRLMTAKDKRVKLTTTTFRGIKSLKLYGWLEPFYFEVKNARKKELAVFRLISIINAFLGGIFSSADNFVSIMIFLAFLWKNMGALTPDIVFPTLELLQLIMIPFVMIPGAASNYYNALVSLNRIQDLLNRDALSTNNYTHHLDGSSVLLDHAVIAWEDHDTQVLSNVTLSAANGELVCITGRVGSGKTAILKSLCGELHVLSGSVEVSGRLAYCSQQPWLQNTTVRANIIFGREFDPLWYSQVLQACDLSKDIESFPSKDQTEIGERGIMISGGQKARIALARAIYSRPSVYIFDDVLSAVDEHVAAHLMTHVFSETGIIGGSTVVMATNNVKLLGYASKVVSLADGAVAEVATLPEILAAGESSPTYRLLKEFGTGKASLSELSVKSIPLRSAKPLLEPLPLAKLDASEMTALVGQEEEERDQVVSFNVYWRFLSAAGACTVALAVFFVVISSVVTYSIPLVLSTISRYGFTDISEAGLYLWLYVFVTLASAVFLVFRMYWIMVKLSLDAVQKLHDLMLNSLIHAPMSFFDSTPVGRVLNRFSGSLEGILNVGVFLAEMVSFLASLAFSFTSVVIASPFELLIVAPLIYALNQYRILYVSSSRQIRRMTTAANTPILTQIEETLKGGAIVRAFNLLPQFEQQYDARTDYWIELNFVREQLSGWLSWRINSFSAFLKVTTAVSLTWILSHGRLNVGLIGAILIYTERVGDLCGSFVRQYSQLEVQAVELQRILEYIDVDQEAPAHIPETNPGSEWPSDGRLECKDLTVRYNPESGDILHNLSFALSRHEKIGVVGRTGAGKSTLSLAIFRLVEALKGNFELDGIDTSKIGLTDLRSRLSIIPQDAQIFSGTVRYNLDPYGNETDEALWNTLEICHLKDYFSSLQGLDTVLDDDGDNISRGQAQLVCLCRALLRPSTLLVLDEATASVDLETDRVIQQTIRAEFKNRTIVTIAHRLETLDGYDRIMVLDKGQVAEFDTPDKLVEKKGLFWSLQNASKAS